MERGSCRVLGEFELFLFLFFSSLFGLLLGERGKWYGSGMERGSLRAEELERSKLTSPPPGPTKPPFTEKEVSQLFPTLHNPSPPSPLNITYPPTYLSHPQEQKYPTQSHITLFLFLFFFSIPQLKKFIYFLIKNPDTLGITSSPNYWTTETPKLILGYTTDANQLWWSIYSLDGEVGDLGFNVCFSFFFFFFSWHYIF